MARGIVMPHAGLGNRDEDEPDYRAAYRAFGLTDDEITDRLLALTLERFHITQAVLERRDPDDTKPMTVAEFVAKQAQDAGKAKRQS